MSGVVLLYSPLLLYGVCAESKERKKLLRGFYQAGFFVVTFFLLNLLLIYLLSYYLLNKMVSSSNCLSPYGKTIND